MRSMARIGSGIAVLTGAVLMMAAVRGVPAADGEQAVGDLGKVGTVRFPTSCDPALQGEFELVSLAKNGDGKRPELAEAESFRASR